MYNIYIIKNKINDKVYVGKTSKSIDERFKAHIKDCVKFSHRKLYKDMIEFGCENFYIENLDTTDNNNSASELENFYIKKYNSYHNGYNGNYGGDGKKLIDDKIWTKIISYINENQDYTLNKLSKIFHIDKKTIKGYFIQNNIDYIKYNPKSEKVSLHKYTKISCYDKNDNLIKDFYKYDDIALFINKDKKSIGNILKACSGKRITAYGYKWVGFE
jgi:hypothetical protein